MSKPSVDDLKQMYAYNMYWEANKSMLLYPNIHGANNQTNYGIFHKGTPKHDNDGNYCKLGFVDVWNLLIPCFNGYSPRCSHVFLRFCTGLSSFDRDYSQVIA